jgi:predicted N-acyltransferase
LRFVTETPDKGNFTATIGGSVAAIPASEWDAAAGDANPFVSHAFLSALEKSGSVGGDSGWQPVPLGVASGFAPAYLKTHSQGEYVFDHSWADAWERAGGDYYPKLLIAAPFTPAPGPRLLTADEAVAKALIRTAELVVDRNGLSSAHANFVEPNQLALFRQAGWLIREGQQFHWHNRGYADFDAFLADLSSRKRKAIRKERREAQEAVEIVALTGAELDEAAWDAFWVFYQDTGSRKWGRPYLTREFFTRIGETMADKILLVMARRDGAWVAGALNFIGSDTLYGRYWGCVDEVPYLHFELCYYQAIDWAIRLGLSRVEAGAQGEHKLARGYLPVATWSAHYIADRGFRSAVADFVEREAKAVEHGIDVLTEMGPFKKA